METGNLRKYLPLTLFGLFFIIGILGFVPFFTGFVYLRNGVRCLRQIKEIANNQQLIGSVLLGAALVIGMPFAAHWKVNQMISESVEQILHSDSEIPEAAVHRLKYLKWCIDADDFVRAYEKENDQNRKDRLSKAYEDLTGESIETRLAILND